MTNCVRYVRLTLGYRFSNKASGAKCILSYPAYGLRHIWGVHLMVWLCLAGNEMDGEGSLSCRVPGRLPQGWQVVQFVPGGFLLPHR